MLNTAFRQSCLNMTGPLIDYMDTKSIVRDHESVRIALGGEPMTYVGNSYGSQLGEQYAEAYPDKIRAMVLDGVVSQSPSEISNYIMGASAAESSLRYFFSWCSSQDAKTCPLAHRVKNQTLEQSWMNLMKRANDEGIPCLGKTCTRSTVFANDIRTSAYPLLYTPALSFGALAQALYDAYMGNGTAFSYVRCPTTSKAKIR
jgi:pimeloyl-ACP methyl ester carboxylesterase